MLAALLLTAAASAAFIDPRQFWLPSLLGLTYPVLLLLNLFLAAIWLVFRWKVLFIPLAAACITWPVLRTFIAWNHRKIPEQNTVEIRLMSYNVRNFDLYNWNDGDSTLERILSLIRTEKPDVACFQEFFNADTGTFTTIRKLMKESGFRYYRFHESIRRKGYGAWGVATFSRYPIVKHRGEALAETGYNSYLMTDIAIEGDTVRVFNAHLRSVYLSQGDYEYIDEVTENQELHVKPARRMAGKIKRASVARAPQADILRNAVQHSRHPVVLCGDFNDTPCSYTYRTAAHSLQDAFLTAGSGIESTFAYFRFPLRIDYILATDSLLISEYKCIDEKLSDHFPITCRIHLR